MKKIVPALNQLQLACMDKKAPLSAIGHARKELFAAIREALVDAINNTRGDVQITDEMVKKDIAFLSKFEKLNAE